MPNTPKKHAANFYLSREATDRVKAIAATMDTSASAIVAMCIDAALPTIEALPATIKAETKERLCPK